MKKQILYFFLVLLSLPIFAQVEKKVLILGIDGCRSDALLAANTPNLDILKSQGVFSPDALNSDITISGPGWSAMLCGVWSDKHLVQGNDFSGNNYVEYPSIFQRIEAFNSELNTVSFVHWGPINDWIVADDADFKLSFGSDLEVEETAASYLLANDVDVMYLHFDDVDHAGHSYGFSPDVLEYISAIEIVDGNIGGVIAALESRPNYENEDWLVLVSTDHGGNGTSHGGNSIGEQNIFIIANGKNIPDEVILKETTIVDPPENCLNQTTELTFDGSGDYVQVADNPMFNFGESQDFTIECRVRTDNAADVSIIGNKDWDSGVNPGFVVSFRYAAGPEWKVNIGDGNSRVDVETGGEIADNDWHTLSVSFDRDAMLTMYEDGIEVGSADISGIGNIGVNEGLFFGSDILGAYSYEGAIAEVRVWNSVLSSDEIEEWACTEISDTHSSYENLIGYWKMNEGEGDSVVDYSGNNNTGTIINATWQDVNGLEMDDYTNTPRITDVAVSALTHLCVPINPDWNLDGNSLIADCMPSSTKDLNRIDFTYNLSPNPVFSDFNIEILDFDISKSYQYEILDLMGKVIQKENLKEAFNSLNVNKLENGDYIFSLISEGEKKVSKKFSVLR